MPMYDMMCGHENYLSFPEFDRLKAGRSHKPCPTCGVDLKPVSANLATFYGAWRCSDSVFRDAEEATGETIRSTKDIDRLEKQGVIRAVTNPSRHRKFKDKK